MPDVLSLSVLLSFLEGHETQCRNFHAATYLSPAPPGHSQRLSWTEARMAQRSFINVPPPWTINTETYLVNPYLLQVLFKVLSVLLF